MTGTGKSPAYLLDLRRKGLGEGISASAILCQENGWNPDVGITSHRDGEELGAFEAHEFTMLGLALSFAEKARALSGEHNLPLMRVEVTVQYLKNWVTTVPRQEISPGLIAVGEGYNRYTYIVRVKTDLPNEYDEKIKFEGGLLIHSVFGFDNSLGKVQVEVLKN